MVGLSRQLSELLFDLDEAISVVDHDHVGEHVGVLESAAMSREVE